jgi:RNA polymerase sigma-70 factor (ECF subfamily)
MRTKLVSLEDLEVATAEDPIPDVDRLRAFDRLFQLIHELKPLDRQIMISYLEDLDAGAIADIVGLSPANIAMKIHRIKAILVQRFREVQPHG